MAVTSTNDYPDVIVLKKAQNSQIKNFRDPSLPCVTESTSDSRS